ncbi:MAG: TonB family protein [Steroidobacteraceae bacterium]
MTTYEESPLLSGRRGAALAAVVLLHLGLGFALYSGLGAQIKKALDPAPLNLMPIAPPRDPVKPLPRVPVINELKLYVAPPEVPPSLPLAEPELSVEDSPPEPRTMIQPSVPQPRVHVPARLDPKHPLRIGEAYFPDASRRANEMGRCVVEVTVAVDGRITAAAIQSSTGFKRLDLACVNAVRGQRMLPAFEDGRPIESSVAVPIVWNLTDQ